MAGENISPGEETMPEEALGYVTKTIEFLSSVDGSLEILVDLVGDGDFKLYAAVSITANTPKYITITDNITYIKLRFTTTAESAVVTGKYHFM
jgi:hypothetical protein